MTTASTLAAQIIELARTEQWVEGVHLPAQQLADRLSVSRQPIAAALQHLQDLGLVERAPNRGFFWCCDSAGLANAASLGGVQIDDRLVDAVYFKMAEERLAGTLPESVTETLLRERYQLSRAQLQQVLGRIAQEGWIERKPGYGWRFTAMLTTPESLLQSYRLRLALEPAALMEPSYRWDAAVSQRCRAAELHLLEGGIAADNPLQLHDRGVNFHESLVAASGNPFFIDAIQRVNRVRRLLSYRSTQDRSRYREHCQQHLHILSLLDEGRQSDAAAALHEHLARTLVNVEKLMAIL